MKVYLASSWRNTEYPDVLARLRAEGFDVYDFRAVDGSFNWKQTALDDTFGYTPEELRAALHHPLAERAYDQDMTALMDADVVVMLEPCGKSASMEFGYAVGAGKYTIACLWNSAPELMVKMATELVCSVDQLVYALDRAGARA